MIPGIVAGRVLAAPPLFPNDPSYANVKSLILFDGANNSTSFTDQVRPWLWTRNSTPVISTAQSKFGGASGLFNGSSQYLTTVDNAELELGSSDFTIEGWVYPTSYPNSFHGLAGKWGAAGQRGWDFGIRSGAGLEFWWTTDGTTNQSTTSATTVSLNAWHHIAVCRNGANLRMFLDGVQVGTTANIGSQTIFNTTQAMTVGRGSVNSAEYFAGHIDCFRLKIGTALYTTNFTPSTTRFGETSGSILDDTWNPLGADPALTFSNGNHTIVRPASGNDTPDNSALSCRARSYGKVYAECTMNRDGGGWSGYFGFINADTVISAISSENYTNGLQIAPSRGFVNTRIVREGVAGTVNKVYGSGVVVGVAIDIEAGKAWIRQNDDWVKSDLSTTTSYDASSPTVTWSPAGRNFRLFAMSPFSGTECTLNVGATAFARTPPTGFGAW